MISTPLLIIGSGPVAVVTAELASAVGIASLLVGEPSGAAADAAVGAADERPVALTPETETILARTGLLGVLGPHVPAGPPSSGGEGGRLWIAPAALFRALRRHCVADLMVTVYDGMTVTDPTPRAGGGFEATIGDGTSSWTAHAASVVDARALPEDLNAGVGAAWEAVTGGRA
ncbi:MAG: hypothetical protein ACK5RL_09160 [Acidimicrobiales bacterium]